MKTYAEQVADLEATRAARVARMEEVAKKAMDESRSMESSEKEEFDEIKGEIKQLDGDLERYRDLAKMSAMTAAPVDADAAKAATEQGAERFTGQTIIVKKTDEDEKFEGQNFTRLAIAKALANNTGRSAGVIAEERWSKSSPNLVNIIKADVAGGGSGAGEWGNELVSQDTWMGDFQEYLYGKTVYNQLPLREVPANVLIKGQDGAATGYWVGESKSIPVSAADFKDVTLTPLKVGALSVVSNELLRDSSPSAEMLIRDALVEACVQRIDTTFISTAAAVASVSPAGILNNISATTSSGTTGDDVANDFKELMYRFTQAKNAGGEYIVMNPALATGLSLLRNALDQYEFPTLTRNGGTIYGMPVITGDNVNANYLVMLKPSDIYRIGMGGIEVSVSQQATIEMANNPAGGTDTPTAPTGKFVGMFQTESTAMKVTQSINFARRRESAVAWISDADYGGAIST